MIITNSFEGVGVSVTGEQVNTIIQAIPTARKETPLIDAGVIPGSNSSSVPSILGQ